MEHYYSEKQKSPLNLKKISQNIKGVELEFYTASGIFSKEKIDKGTLILAENMAVKQNSKVLDIGCGIGILGIAAAKIFDADVVMGDINERAVMLAEKNAKLNNVDADVCQGSLYEKIKGNDFEVILSNPPQAAGKDVCFKLIEGSKSHLKHGGSLQLVARHNKGGKTLSKKMEDVFGNVKAIAKKSGYWVYLSVKN
ncbi:class I SAM-dependent methyltransferase [Candidatus Woesearchaeota archaeon]|nr:class I SAM-dependent methyltransferase [Candidatus Woesearchaeota archaeon]